MVLYKRTYVHPSIRTSLTNCSVFQYFIVAVVEAVNSVTLTSSTYSASQVLESHSRVHPRCALDNTRVAVLFRRVVDAKAHAKKATSLPALVRYMR